MHGDRKSGAIIFAILVEVNLAVIDLHNFLADVQTAIDLTFLTGFIATLRDIIFHRQLVIFRRQNHAHLLLHDLINYSATFNYDLHVKLHTICVKGRHYENGLATALFHLNLD